MKNINIGKSDILASKVALGCMRIGNMKKDELLSLINTAIESGINTFDHADIYGNGKCEEIFGEVLKISNIKRENIIIQSKCSIRDGFFDYSKEHILNSVDKILKRLKTDYLDILLLHRPDTLMDLDEVSEAFNLLIKSGKVRNFGVSNNNSMQIELLNKYIDNKIIVNQLQFSLTNTGIIDSGLNVNMKVSNSIDRDGSILEYCRLKDITIQAWSPFQYGFFEGIFLDNEKFPELNKKLKEISKKYDITTNALAIAWILRHPANMQTIIGSTNETRIKEICRGADIVLTREEWYDLYKSAGNILP